MLPAVPIKKYANPMSLLKADMPIGYKDPTSPISDVSTVGRKQDKISQPKDGGEVRQDLSTLTDPLTTLWRACIDWPPLSLSQEQEQEYRLGGDQIHHDFEHPVAKHNEAKGNVLERAVFRLGRETLFCPVPQASQ